MLWKVTHSFLCIYSFLCNHSCGKASLEHYPMYWSFDGNNSVVHAVVAWRYERHQPSDRPLLEAQALPFWKVLLYLMKLQAQMVLPPHPNGAPFLAQIALPDITASIESPGSQRKSTYGCLIKFVVYSIVHNKKGYHESIKITSFRINS